jgi:hypothetical protein
VRLRYRENMTSGVHAYVAADSRTMLVRDASSAQGTYIDTPGGNVWTRWGLEPSPGWSIRIGHYVFAFQPGGSSDA